VVTIGSWRNRQTRHVQTVQIGVRIPASRPFPAWRNWPTPPAQDRCACGFESHRWDHSGGDIVEGKDSALSARQYGFESRCPRQNGLVVQRRALVAEGRDGDLGGLISLGMRVQFPPPLPTAGSFNGRTAVLQTAHGGSIPSPATIRGGRRQTVRREAVNLVLTGSTPVAHPSSPGRRVIGSPPASGAGVWRFESSRPDHWQIVQRQDSGL
jgi:hypothetical protein